MMLFFFIRFQMFQPRFERHVIFHFKDILSIFFYLSAALYLKFVFPWLTYSFLLDHNKFGYMMFDFKCSLSAKSSGTMIER